MSRVEDSTSVEQGVYQALQRVFLLLDDCDRRFFSEYGLSSRQYWALQTLDQDQGRPMVDLSRLLFTDKSNVTSIVDRLEAAGLAARTAAPNDRRVILVKLTEEGRRVRDFVRKQHDVRVRDLMGTLAHEDLHKLRDLLSVVGQSLETYLANGGSPPSLAEGACSDGK
jgi:DNA-binding MarR family transcriptional regulator